MKIIFFITTCLFLISCGGGGDSSSTQSVPPPSTTNNSPSILTDESIQHNENSLQVAILSATDPEQDQITFSISGGADSSLFTVNENTLLFSQQPNYENPLDHNTDNIYEIIILASDGNTTTSKLINISIQDIQEIVVRDVLRKSVDQGNPAPIKIETAEFITQEEGIGIEVFIERDDTLYGDIEFLSTGEIEYIYDLDSTHSSTVIEQVNINVNTTDGRDYQTRLEIEIPPINNSSYDANICNTDTNNLRFDRQSSIYEFLNDNPTCNVIDGDLTIVKDFHITSSDLLNEVDALANIKEIRGSLSILSSCSGLSVSSCDDKSIDLDGLSGLKIINGTLRFGLYSSDFEFFPNLLNVRGVNICIPTENQSLLRGFYSLENIIGELHISSCSSSYGADLIEIDAFHRLKNVTSDIRTTWIRNLSTITPASFSNLESVGSPLYPNDRYNGTIRLGIISNRGGPDGQGSFSVNFTNLSIYKSIEISEYAQIKNMGVTTERNLKYLVVGCFNGIPPHNLQFIEQVDELRICNSTDTEVELDSLREVNNLIVEGHNISAPNLLTVDNLDLRGQFFSRNLNYIDTLILSKNRSNIINFDDFLSNNATVENITMVLNGVVDEIVSNNLLTRNTNSILIDTTALQDVSGFESFRNLSHVPKLKVVNNPLLLDCMPFSGLFTTDDFPNAPERFIYDMVNIGNIEITEGLYSVGNYAREIIFPFGSDDEYSFRPIFYDNGCEVIKPKVINHSFVNNNLEINIDSSAQHIFRDPRLILKIKETKDIDGFPISIDYPNVYEVNLNNSSGEINSFTIEAIIEHESQQQLTASIVYSNGETEDLTFSRAAVRDEFGRDRPNFFKAIIHFTIPFEHLEEKQISSILFKDILSNRPATIHDITMHTWKRFDYNPEVSTILVENLDAINVNYVTLNHFYPDFGDFIYTSDGPGRENRQLFVTYIDFRSVNN